jgi:hypothetical protein
MNKNIIYSVVLATLVATNPTFAQVNNYGALQQNKIVSQNSDLPPQVSEFLASFINYEAAALVQLTTPQNGSSPLSKDFSDYDSAPFVEKILNNDPPDSFSSNKEAFLYGFTAMSISGTFANLSQNLNIDTAKTKPWLAKSFDSISEMTPLEKIELVSGVADSIRQNYPIASFLVTNPSTTKGLNQTINFLLENVNSQPNANALGLWANISSSILANNSKDSAAYKEALPNLISVLKLAKDKNLNLEFDLSSKVSQIPEISKIIPDIKINNTATIQTKILNTVKNKSVGSLDMHSSLVDDLN